MKVASNIRVSGILWLILVLTLGSVQYKHESTVCRSSTVPVPVASALATSSRSLKKTTHTRSVISRLAKAAKEAAASKKLERDKRVINPLVKEGQEVSGELSTISNLNSIIDAELLVPKGGHKRSRESDSIRDLLQHNIDNEAFLMQEANKESNSALAESYGSSHDSTIHKKGKTKIRPHHVAIIFARPLVDNKVTIEYASRLILLAKLIRFEDYRPELICFCGPHSSTISSHVGDTDGQKHGGAVDTDNSAGVIYFRHLCTANNISLTDIDLCRIPDPVAGSLMLPNGFGDSDDIWDQTLHGESLSTPSTMSSPPSTLFHPLVEQLLQNRYLEEWLDESQVYESEMDEYGMSRQEPRKKIQIHWTLVSTEYHLCNLNDIHIRSPRQSPLATLVHELEQSVTKRYRRGIIKNSWSFKYSVYPYVYYKEDDGHGVLVAFLGKCYLMSQELVPLLVNLWGVAGNTEFFQRDNYRTLVATRRSLAALLEEVNEAYRHNQERKTPAMIVPPTLKAQLQQVGSKTAATGKMAALSADVHLENALLSLGRCCDLVRPAGTFSSQSVSKQEWRAAIQHLQDFMWRIEQTCDPDHPLPAEQWGTELSRSSK